MIRLNEKWLKNKNRKSIKGKKRYRELDALLWILLSIVAFFLHKNLRTVHAKSNDMVIWALVLFYPYGLV